MRCHVRMGLAVWSLAVAVPAFVWADNPPQAQPAPSNAPHKHRWGLFRSQMCSECQRQMVMKRDGVNVPPPPEIMGLGETAQVAPAPGCKVCQGETGIITAGPVITGTMIETVEAAPPSGYAVIGGSVPLAEPMPIGVGIVQSLPGRASTMPDAGNANARRRGQADPSVMQTSLAPDTIAAPRASRPHILSHVLGFDAIGRKSAEERERRTREEHASIVYGPKQAEQVTDVPASAVFGKGH